MPTDYTYTHARKCEETTSVKVHRLKWKTDFSDLFEASAIVIGKFTRKKLCVEGIVSLV